MEIYQSLQSIRKLRQAAYKLWKISIEFADAEGKPVGKDGPQTAGLCPMCKVLSKARLGQQLFDQSLKQNALKLAKIKKYYGPIKQVCPGGMLRFSAPIIMNGRFLGFVFAEGLPTADLSSGDKSKIISGLSRIPVNESSLKSALDRLVYSKQTQDTLQTFLDLIVEEIGLFHRDVNIKDVSVPEPVESGSTERKQFDAIIGQSEALQRIFRLLEKVVTSDATVMIQGESGTGKELLAKAVHYNSGRKHRPFVVANCSAFNDNLLESELFGHVKGAFTGAIRDKKGLFEMADGGSFFLDEVGDMSMALQVKLLRVLQEGTFMSVGGTKQKKVDVRIVAATNKNLTEMVRQGTFREDLYYRMNVINMVMPPLRDRKSDIPILVDHFLKKHSKPNVEKRLTPECSEKILMHRWPGNVRELENEVERLIVLSGNQEEIDDSFLSPQILGAEDSLADEAFGLLPNVMATTLPEAVEQMERQMILHGLRQTRWNKSKLAKRLGISRRNLIRKIARYELEKRQRA